MAVLPLPVAILDDLIPGTENREWGHPRWRPEAEGPQFSTTTTMGIEKLSTSPDWRHFRRRHLGVKMAAPQVTSGGRRDSGEDVPSSEMGRPSPKTSRRRYLYFKRSIWSLASPNFSRNGWGNCLIATMWKSISLHVSTPRSMGSMKRGVDFGKQLLYFFYFLFLFFNCTL